MRYGNPRPKKYESDAERQKAFRSRFATLSTRVKVETAETLERISAETGMSRAELMNQMIQFALTNRNWFADPRFTRALTAQSMDDRRVATKYVKDQTLRGDDDKT